MEINKILNQLEYIIDKLDKENYEYYIEISNDLTTLFNEIYISQYIENLKNNLQVEKRIEQIKTHIKDLKEKDNEDI